PPPLPHRGRNKAPQQVRPGDFPQIGIAPAAACELLEQGREAVYALKPRRGIRNAVEVRAEADVLGPRHLADVLDVIGDIAEGDGWFRVRLLPRLEGRRAA